MDRNKERESQNNSSRNKLTGTKNLVKGSRKSFVQIVEDWVENVMPPRFNS